MVEIQNLTKYYGNKAALKGISFTIKENEVLGFLGPNGAGKSTTLNIMAGCQSKAMHRLSAGDPAGLSGYEGAGISELRCRSERHSGGKTQGRSGTCHGTPQDH